MKPKTQLAANDKSTRTTSGSPIIDAWLVINDGVMGGKSMSKIERAETGHQFSGVVSPENGGGFASVRTTLRRTPAKELQAVSFRVRGDGNRYKFRLRTDDRFGSPSYSATFETTPNVWQEVTLTLDEFQAMYHGRTIAGAPPLDSEKIKQMGFLIADKQFGSFRLEFGDIEFR